MMNTSNKDFDKVRALVGETITKENLLFVDSFIYKALSIFMPIGGSCGYAVSPKHKHPSYMFVIAYDNETTVYVGDEKYETSPNTMFCLSPNIEHHEVQNYLPPKYCAIFIDKDLFENAFMLYSKELLLLNALVIDIKNSKLNMLIKEFIFESQNIHQSKDIILDKLSSLVIHEIVRNILKYDSRSYDITDNQMINEMVAFINTNYDKNITIDDFAALTKLSKSHLTKLFSNNMNVSPMKYLKLIRLQNAKKMLLSNTHTITKISQQCGFTSPAYFTKSFKEAFLETPKEFIQRVK
ncbi:helix-turn-helix domain-containing protein [Sulfurimonas sp. CS5]|uniref:helix-turn-helix domain-containing protein n=1 Tax=Sulfurimonas sp. CS5 TaxID=3391145 RepID=UPI0039EBCAA4